MTLYVEITTDPYHGKGTSLKFTPTADLEGLTGFRTIAQWNEVDIGLAQAAGTIKALKDVPCVIDTLFVDFDNQERDAIRFRDWLKSELLTYEMWDSGGRSQHFHIPIVPLHSADAPSSLKQFMKVHCRNLAYDSSIYAYTSLFRLPNTEHAKTGRKKTLLEANGIDILHIDLKQPERYENLIITDIDEFNLTMSRYGNLLQNSPDEGNRSITLWSIAKSFCEVGLSYETTEELLFKLNDSWGDAGKEYAKVLSQLKYAYQK